MKYTSIFIISIMLAPLVYAAAPSFADNDQTNIKIKNIASIEKPAELPVFIAQNEPEVETSIVTQLTCQDGIRRVWPAELQESAIIVSQHENRSQNPSAIGPVNPDVYGSHDYGCFQINDHWHPDYFSQGDWTDPVWAAQYAYRIYQGRQAQTGNGWSAWYAVKNILW